METMLIIAFLVGCYLGLKDMKDVRTGKKPGVPQSDGLFDYFFRKGK